MRAHCGRIGLNMRTHCGRIGLNMRTHCGRIAKQPLADLNHYLSANFQPSANCFKRPTLLKKTYPDVTQIHRYSDKQETQAFSGNPG
jgi:hypothetical protein